MTPPARKPPPDSNAREQQEHSDIWTALNGLRQEMQELFSEAFGKVDEVTRRLFVDNGAQSIQTRLNALEDAETRALEMRRIVSKLLVGALCSAAGGLLALLTSLVLLALELHMDKGGF